MANFSSFIFPGRIATAFTDPNKGTVNNRFECAGEHIKTKTKSLLQLGLVGGTAAGVTYAAHKNSIVADVLLKGMKGVKNLLGKNKYTAKIGEFVSKMMSNLPKTGKIGLAAAAVALPFLYLIDHKDTYKAGQIDQKYTDKASVQSQLDTFITLNKMS